MPRWDHFHTIETWDINRREYPKGKAFHLKPDTRTLRQLMRFADSVTKHVDLCDHIAAYSTERPLFIYHGTFWEPLFVSTHIPRSKVEAFSRGIGISFEQIDFKQTYFSES